MTGSIRRAIGVLALLGAVVGIGATTGFTAAPLDVALREERLGGPAARTRAELSSLEREVQRLRAAWASAVPGGVYMVVDRANNRLYLRRGRRVLLEAVVSAGSGAVLKEPGGRRRIWVFDTPQGVFRVRAKVRDPVWIRPDWAFVEEGRPVPTGLAERLAYGALGEYALYFGDGYMIHGTLYERLLGRNVTHGCIRVGRDDLRRIFAQVPVGTPIYIF